MQKKWIFSASMILVFLLSAIVSADQFIRGDANSDGKVNIADSQFIQNYLFLGQANISCLDAADVDDNGKIEMADTVSLNNFLFLGGKNISAPYPNVGIDPTNDSLSCENNMGQGGGPITGVCQPSYCADGNSESNEGSGGDYCCMGLGGGSGYEECTDFRQKSTAHLSAQWGQDAMDGTDYCKDSVILKEIFIDCNLFADTLWEYEKDCNDFDNYGDWEYYCESGKVLKHRRFYNFGCSNGACNAQTSNYQAPVVVSQVGDDAYCSDKIAANCGKCTQGEYDCDDGQCAAGLECKSDWDPFSSDGCCKITQQWNTNTMKCVDCYPADGVCCGSDNKFKSSEIICSTIGDREYSCRDGNCLNNDIFKKDKVQYCSGSSASCNGGIFSITSIQEDCLSGEFCKGSTSWSSTKPVCAGAQCNSGACCDASCNVYAFKSSNTICNTASEEGCPWGTALDNDAGKRSGNIYCSGASSSCNQPVQWGNWQVKQSCSNKEFCSLIESSASCSAIACSSNTECGTNGYLNQPYCQENDVWDTYARYTCSNGGKVNAQCSSTNEARKKSDCGDNSESAPYCSGSNLVKDINLNFCDSAACKSSTNTQTIEDCLNKGGCVACGGSNACKDKCGLCLDADSDGYGIANLDKCPKPNIKDCDDSDVNVNPGKAEVTYNGKDDDCNPATKDNDLDNDGHLKPADCNDNNANIHPGAAEICKNGIDEDCSGADLTTCPCTNKCPAQGATQCSSNIQQTCGDYNSDTCLEWGSDIACPAGCSNAQCNKPDLTISSFIVQYPRTEPIPINSAVTLAFTIKNIGNANATNVFWRYSFTGESDKQNTNALSIPTGSTKTIFVMSNSKLAGVYSARALVDPDNKITELNENNNEKTLSMQVV